MTAELRSVIREAVVAELAIVVGEPPGAFTDERRLEEFGLDSMATVEVLIGVYDALLFPEAEPPDVSDSLSELATVGQLVEFVVQKAA